MRCAAIQDHSGLAGRKDALVEASTPRRSAQYLAPYTIRPHIMPAMTAATPRRCAALAITMKTIPMMIEFIMWPMIPSKNGTAWKLCPWPPIPTDWVRCPEAPPRGCW